MAFRIESLSLPSNLNRASTSVLTPSRTTPSFLLGQANRSYKHQYANIYFVRLRILRPIVEQRANKLWKNIAGSPKLVPRVLEVLKSQLCYIIGTVYLDMPLKPNVMEDIARDHSIPPPPPPKKFYSPEDNVMVEDESGRIRLVGERLKAARLVTGVVIGVLGMETLNGDFEVVDICHAEMAPQSSTELDQGDDTMDIDDQKMSSLDEWIGVVSGLKIGSLSPSDAQIQMLVEYLAGEAGGLDDQVSAAQISRLIIAGNSLDPASITTKGESVINVEDRKARRYGYDAATFSPHPMHGLSAHLLDLGKTIPIHILPGDTDPSSIIMPQQPFPRAMFGDACKLSSLSCETNPTYLSIATGSAAEEAPQRPRIKRSFLIHSGQPLNDVFKYLPSPPHTRLSILESTLRWRHMAPTAPDTLWCHPYFTTDPFLLPETPDIYIVGGQNKFGTKLVVDQLSPKERGEAQKRCRIVMVPSFARTGTLVLVNLRTLDVRCVNLSVEGMTGGGEEPQNFEKQPPIPDLTPEVPMSSASSPSPELESHP